MKVVNWFSSPIISILFLALCSVNEAALPIGMLRSMAQTSMFRRYQGAFWEYFGREWIRLLPIFSPISPENTCTALIDEIDILESKTKYLSNNSEVVLGDVLIDVEGAEFFFMSGAGTDGISSVLIRASTGNCEHNHRITEYYVAKKFQKESINYLDYSNDAVVKDKFKVVQVYEGFALLGSNNHGIMFVAPNDDIDGFIRGELQRRLKKGKNLELKRQEEERKKILEFFSVDRTTRSVNLNRSNQHSDSWNSTGGESSLKRSIASGEAVNYKPFDYDEDAFVSPDSVVKVPLLNRKRSYIQKLFGQIDGPNSLRSEFIKEQFVKILLKRELEFADAMTIVRTAERVFRNEMTVGYINIKREQKITVVGDIHGQFGDLLRFFTSIGWPSAERLYLFNGDIVDRGSGSIECLLLLYTLKITFPESVFINRGNHETETCGNGQFEKDCYVFDDCGDFFRACHAGFVALPIAHVLNERIYVVHGGIRGDYSIKDIAKMNRFDAEGELKEYVNVSLWDDECDSLGVTANPARGPSMSRFGPDVTDAFLQLNEFNLLIRSHTFIEEGLRSAHDGKCWTVFSAPNYCGLRNVAAVITFDSELNPDFTNFKSRNS